jgi:hypothetical protein
MQTRWKFEASGAGASSHMANDDEVLEHDVDWLLAQCDQDDKAVLVASDEAGRLVPFFVHDGQLDLKLGEATLGSLKVKRHVLVGNFQDRPALVWGALFAALSARIPTDAAIFLLGVVRGEGLSEALALPELRARFRVLRQGAKYERRLCRLDTGLAVYLVSLTAKHRQNLKRSLRRFETQFSGRAQFAVYSTRDEVHAFLDVIEPVSRRTYQARLLGLGVDREGYLGTKVIAGAQRGYARCYLLSVDGRPIAWRIGFLYKGVYYSHHVGYEPDFEEWHPGVVTHLYSIRDLTEACTGVHTLDMLYGDNDFKRKAGNAARTECNYYLFPRSLRGTVCYLSLLSCNALSAAVGGLLELAGLKVRLKAWLRGC